MRYDRSRRKCSISDGFNIIKKMKRVVDKRSKKDRYTFVKMKNLYRKRDKERGKKVKSRIFWNKEIFKEKKRGMKGNAEEIVWKGIGSDGEYSKRMRKNGCENQKRNKKKKARSERENQPRTKNYWEKNTASKKSNRTDQRASNRMKNGRDDEKDNKLLFRWSDDYKEMKRMKINRDLT